MWPTAAARSSGGPAATHHWADPPPVRSASPTPALRACPRAGPRLWIVLWSTRWRNVCRGGQPRVNCGWLVDGERILKLLAETSCAVSAIGVEISSPPGTVTGEGETPSHPAKDNSGLSGKEKSSATGKEETPSHRCGGNPGPPGIGQTSGPLVSGKVRCHPARGEPARGNLEPPAQGKLQGMWRRGNPESRAEEKALGRRRRENFKLCGGGETPSCVMRRKL